MEPNDAPTLQPDDGSNAPDPWHAHVYDPDAGGPEFGRLLKAMRDLQDQFVAALVPTHEVDALVDQIGAMQTTLRRWQVEERQAPSGARNDLPGRGNLLYPPFVTDRLEADAMQGRVTFTRFHVGGNNAAHGGVVPLLFDEVLGRLVNGRDRPVARTAYLNVNYRHVTRVGVEHRIEGEALPVRGRKRFAVGRLYFGDVLTAEVDALFVELRTGQP